MFKNGTKVDLFKNMSPAWSLIPLLAAIFFSLPLLKAGLVWDDIIFESRQLPYFKKFSDAFFAPAGVESLQNFYFRPVVLLSYMFDQWVASSDGYIPAAFAHAANVGYHLVSTLFLYWLALLLFRGTPYKRFGALVAALIFALHPIHAETVMNISGRTDGMATMFLLAAAVAAIYWRDRGSWTVAISSSIFIILSMLAKEIGVSALFIIPTLVYFAPYDEGNIKTPSVKRLSIITAIIFFSVVLYLIFRLSFGFSFGDQSSFGFSEKLIRLAGALGYYLKKSIFVWPQSHFMPEIPFSASDISALFAAPALLGFLLVKRRTGRWWQSAARSFSLPSRHHSLWRLNLSQQLLLLNVIYICPQSVCVCCLAILHQSFGVEFLCVLSCLRRYVR
ncbi:MAG: hypothetical protein C0609_12850 [Deltaproteobacteria bacterium]|nr:MAG: hypothetical protein C0609_12850 [Deltaproteobacteria bacterium]